MKKIFIYHGLTALVAGMGVFLCLQCFGYKLVTYPQKQEKNYPMPLYLSDYRNDFNNQLFIYQNLLKGSSLVVMGSSEMTYQSFPAIPYNFFNCVGLGKPGNRCFSIFSQLCAMSNGLKNANVVIIVSPGWFINDWGNGTDPTLFLDYNNDFFLYSNYFNSELPACFKNYIGEYIGEKYGYLQNPTHIMKLFYYDDMARQSTAKKIIYTPLKTLYHSLCSYEIKLSEEADKRANKPSLLSFADMPENNLVKKTLVCHVKTKNWDSLYAVAENLFKQESTNNNLAVNNTFFSNYQKTETQTHLAILPLDSNKEIRDFGMLVSLLKYYKANAYFIIQPLNPFAYDNLNELKPVITKITQQLTDSNFNYYNMFITKKNDYKKGTLTDLMHFDNLGWYMADSAISSHYNIQ